MGTQAGNGGAKTDLKPEGMLNPYGTSKLMFAEDWPAAWSEFPFTSEKCTAVQFSPAEPQSPCGISMSALSFFGLGGNSPVCR